MEAVRWERGPPKEVLEAIAPPAFRARGVLDLDDAEGELVAEDEEFYDCELEARVLDDGADEFWECEGQEQDGGGPQGSGGLGSGVGVEFPPPASSPAPRSDLD